MSAKKPAKRVKSKNYSAKVIAQAIVMLVAGESVQSVANDLRIPQQTVSAWKAQFPAGFGEIRSKKEVIGDLVAQNLEAVLQANLAQLKIASDEAYLRNQPAGELAVLYGTICDKGFRFLEAAARAEQGTEQRQLPASVDA